MTYIKAVERFVKKYNELNSDKPITQVNVGMKRNDLEEFIKDDFSNDDIKLEGDDFQLFGRMTQNHEGDWQSSQYTIYKDNKIK